MKKLFLFSTVMTGLIASQLALANPSQGFKSYNSSNFPSKTAMQAAPNYVVAIDNNLNESINVSVNDGQSSGSWTYAGNSIDFPNTNDFVSYASVLITDPNYNNALIYQGVLFNNQCITIIGSPGNYSVSAPTNNCMPLQMVLKK